MCIWFGLVTKNAPSSMRPPTRPSNRPIFAVNDKIIQQDITIYEYEMGFKPSGFLFFSNNDFSIMAGSIVSRKVSAK